MEYLGASTSVIKSRRLILGEAVEGDEVPERVFHFFNLAGNCRMWSIDDGDHFIRSHKIYHPYRNCLSRPIVFDPSAHIFLVSPGNNRNYAFEDIGLSQRR
ncbi:MAG: hypothetical protein AMJ88_05685 [Anaerolineae bacterium SM23_ 63]|nr:MAG: hypothetical protein AMJ88_05685 [Anaerolineae bacterium SM23_ 63]